MSDDTELLKSDIESFEQYEAMMDADIGRLCYKGNSVGHWHSKAMANKRGLLEAWEALREAGIHSDGNTSLADTIRKLTRPA